MLPFLKNRDEGGASADADTMTRSPDDDSGFDMLDAVAEDLMKAIEKKDVSLLKEALSALCSHIQDQDQAQDTQMEGE